MQSVAYLYRLNPIYPIQYLSSRPRHTSIRSFTHNSTLLLLSTHQPRPQLPFLYHPLRRLPQHESQRLRAHLSRLITTETRQYIKEQLYSFTRITLYIWAFAGLAAIFSFGYNNAILEQKYPAPSDWSFFTTWRYRAARSEEEPTGSERGLVNWSRTGQLYGDVLARLENEELDGQGLTPAMGTEEGAIYVDGVGATGLNIEGKSDAWRRGYCEILRGSARVAEHLDTWLRERKRRIAFPPEMVIGPQNPRPRPVPYGAASAPRVEDCEPAFATPHVFYGKILTTRGFSVRQKVEAALAYAGWLDFKGLAESAAEVHRWALDLAIEGAEAAGFWGVVERTSGIVHAQAPGVTENVVHAVMGLGEHQARKGELAAALATYASLLRALRALPSTPEIPTASTPPPPPPSQDSLLASISAMLTPPSYPAAPFSGNDLLIRTHGTSCTEAGIMAHIGEILFASAQSSPATHSDSPQVSPSQSSLTTTVTTAASAGLAWTRDAVTLAESTLDSLNPPPQRGSNSTRTPEKLAPGVVDAQERCAECLAMGVTNWELMIARLKQAEEASAVVMVASTARTGERRSSDWRTWIWRTRMPEVEERSGDLATAAATAEMAGEKRKHKQKKRWASEADVVAERAAEVRVLLRRTGFGVNGERLEQDEGTTSIWGF